MNQRNDWVRAARASFACALLTLLALAVGVTIGARLGASSGMDVGQSSYEALMSIRPLLIAAEVLKIGTALAIAIVARSLARVEDARAPARFAGYLGALFLFAAGITGLAALSGTSLASAELGAVVGPLGLASAPLIGLWAALVQGGSFRLQLPAWLKIAAVSLLLLGVASVAFPPVGMLFGLVSLAWWSGLARHAFTRARRG